MFELHTHINPSLLKAICRKKNNYQNYINLASNELQHPKLKILFEKFHNSFDPKSLSHYPYYQNSLDKIVEYSNIPSDNIIYSPGSDLAISLIFSHFSIANKIVILQSPNYYNYKYYAELNSFNIEEINFVERNLDEFKQDLINCMIKSPPALVVLTNPDPYLGIKLSTELIEEVLNTALINNHMIVIDETYAFFGNISHAYLLSRFPNLIILHSLSKSFAAAGIRLALIYSNNEIIKLFRKIGIENGVNRYSLAYINFLLDNQKYFEEIRIDIINIRDVSISNLSKNVTTWKIYQSYANFIAINLKDEYLAKQLTDDLKMRSIIIRNLGELNHMLIGIIRIAIAHEELISSVLEYIKKFYNRISRELSI